MELLNRTKGAKLSILMVSWISKKHTKADVYRCFGYGEFRLCISLARGGETKPMGRAPNPAFLGE